MSRMDFRTFREFMQVLPMPSNLPLPDYNISITRCGVPSYDFCDKYYINLHFNSQLYLSDSF